MPWEYKVLEKEPKKFAEQLEPELNTLGAEGWELVEMMFAESGLGGIYGKKGAVSLVLKRETTMKRTAPQQSDEDVPTGSYLR